MKRGFTELLLADSSFSIPTCYTMLHHATPKFHQITKYATLCNIMQLAKGGKNYCAGNLTHASVGKSSEFDSRVQTISLRT